MALGWKTEARPKVVELIQRFPPESGACADLARSLMPVASEHDPNVVPVVMRPKVGWLVCPKIDFPCRWYHHVLLVLMSHGVDALTGVDGTSEQTYLETHWKYPDQYIIELADLTDETL